MPYEKNAHDTGNYTGMLLPCRGHKNKPGRIGNEVQVHMTFVELKFN